MNRLNRWARVPMLASLLALGSCGGGGGGDAVTPDPGVQQASCTVRVIDFIGVCTGFPDSGNLDWQGGGDGGGSGGVGAGASGDGGVGAGGDFGQFKKAVMKVFLDDGTLLGEAPTDDVKGMVTIRPPKSYTGGLRVELRGGPGAEYFEEGKNRFVPFPADRVIRVWVPRIDKNIGVTIFTEAAYQLLTQGSAPESVGSAKPTPEQVRAANQRVASVLNKQFPSALAVDDVTRLPFIKSPTVAQGAFGADKRGIYGVVSGTFSKQAALFNIASETPTLDALDQLAEDLKDGQLDGSNRGAPAGRINRRTYDPNTLAGELTAALSHQAERFGSAAIKSTLPPVVNYGGTRYEGYLFDGQISKNRTAISTVAGWLAGNALGLTVGQARPKALPAGQSALSMISNFGHGGAFFKIDSTDTTATPVYRVYALGDNVNGELGTGNRNSTNSALVEVTLPGPLTHAAGGFAHSLLRLADGRVFAMGDNTYGQLGQGKDSGELASSATPLEVTLPAAAGGAVAVAATSVASYALMADGSVYTWGSNGGFGLLANGSATGTQTAPAKIAALSDVIQISARDNDVVVLKRDQSIWQWGSHPADVSAFTDGDLSSPYRGGTLVPVAVAGLPTATSGGTTAPIPVRKIITEQGLFAALLDNGHVYTWGVHFDLSAKAVLRDLTAARVLGLPPVRDLMPGGFVGYGARPFDRLTAMAVDYDSGMWKIRGRVAESFDPANPTVQRRPQTGLARSANCASCHTFLDDTMATLRARQAAEAPVPASAAVCLPPATVHVATNGLSLIRAETECIQCHNPARLNPAYAGTLTPAFAASGGWPNCNKPTGLPPRDTVLAEPVTNSCTIPVGHVFTPPGTVCSSCHNSVVARALQDLSPPCAQPGAGELPTLAGTAAITSVSNGGGTSLANGGYSRDGTVRLSGTLSTPLSGAQVLSVLRNGTAIGNAVVSGSSWSFADSGLASGITATYSVRIVQGSGFGATSAPFTVRIDYVAPSVTGSVTTITDRVWGEIADGNFATDAQPTISGTLSGTPDAGDVVQVIRNGIIEGIATVTGTAWSFTEPAPLGLGGHFYQLRLVDAAGNVSAFGTGRSFTLIAGVTTAAISEVRTKSGGLIAPGSITADNAPALTGTTAGTLVPGQVVRVLRNGVLLGSAPFVGTNWSFTDTTPPEGAVSYTVRVDGGAVQGSISAPYAYTIDSIAPVQTAAVTSISDDFVGALASGATTADQTPTASGTLSSPLGSGEQLRLRRTRSTGEVVDVALTPSGTSWSYTETSLVAAGTYTYTAQVFDTAGNTSSFGTSRSVTIDPSAVPLPGATATIASVNGLTPSGGTIGQSTVRTPVLAGSIGRALAADEVVKIFRTGAIAAVGEATVAPDRINWTYTNTTLSDNTYSFTAQVQKSADSSVFGQMSAAVSVTIDATPPVQTIGGLNVADPALISVSGGNTAATSVTLTGNMSAGLGAGEVLQIVRTGTTTGTLTRTVTGATAPGWSFSDIGLAIDSYTYTLRVRDAAGNLGPAANTTVNVIAALPTVAAISVSGAAGGFVSSTTPTVTGSVSASLPGTPAPGGTVRIFRNGLSAGTATMSGVAFSFTDSARPDGSTLTYTARVENGTAYSATSSGVTVTIDSTSPTQTASVVSASSSVMPNTTVFGGVPPSGAITNGGTTNDNSPRLNVQLSAPLATGESLRIRRNGFVVTYTSVGSCGTNCFSVEVPSPLTLNNNEGGGPVTNTIPAATSGTSATFTAMVVDALGREGSTSAVFSITFNYFGCDITRANATYAAANAGANHPSWTSLNCSTCHTASSTTAPTPSGTLVRVPPLGTYWCRRP